MVAASTGARPMITSQPISGTERAAHGLRGSGRRAWPRWNMTAFSPNSGVRSVFGDVPSCLASTAAANASRPAR